MTYKQFLKNIKKQFSYIGEPEVLIDVGENLQRLKIEVANIKDREIHPDHIEFWIVNKSKPDEDILEAKSERMRRKQIIDTMMPKKQQKD